MTGKIAAGVTVALLLVGGFFLFRVVRDIQAGFPFEIMDLTETLDPDGCQGELEVTMRNDSTEQVEIERIAIVLNRGRAGRFVELEPLAVGETTTATVAWDASTSSGCPSTVDEVNHGDLTVHLDNDRTVSKRF